MVSLVIILALIGIDWPVAPTVTFPDGKREAAIVVEIAQQQVLVMTDSCVEVRRNAGLVLEPQSERSLKPRREVVQQVIALLQDKSDELRAGAIELARRLGRDLIEQDVGQLIHSARSDVRKVAAVLLGEIRARDPSPLLKLKWDKDAEVRKLAVRSAARIGGAEVIAFCLDRAENDSDVVVRREALSRLGDCGDLAATPALIDLAEHLESDPYLQNIALRALKRLTRRSFDRDFTEWRRWWQAQAK